MPLQPRRFVLLGSVLVLGLAGCSAPPEGGLPRNAGTSEDDETSAKLPPRNDESGDSSSNGTGSGKGNGGSGTSGGTSGSPFPF